MSLKKWTPVAFVINTLACEIFHLLTEIIPGSIINPQSACMKRRFSGIPNCKVKSQDAFLLSGQQWTFLAIGTLIGPTTVTTLRSIFTFVTLRWLLKITQGQIFLADSGSPTSTSASQFFIVIVDLTHTLFSWSWCLQYWTEGRPTKSTTARKRLDQFRCCLEPEWCAQVEALSLSEEIMTSIVAI